MSLYLQTAAHQLARTKGFWDGPVSLVEKVALIHAELSELLEAYREDPTAQCDKPIPLTREQEELADALIRLLDLAGYLGVNLIEASTTTSCPTIKGTIPSSMIGWAHVRLASLTLAMDQHGAGVARELVAVLCAIEDLADARGIDVWKAAEEKHAYNLTRPHKHNRKF